MPDDEEDTVPAQSLRGTPPDMSQDEIEPLNRITAVTPPPPQNLPSPALSSPGSLYQLGISQLSPLRRQFSAPRATTLAAFSPTASSYSAKNGGAPYGIGPRDDDDPSSSESDDLTRDNQDVLVQRLDDLMKRITQGDDHLNDEAMTALHHKADEMEGILAGKKARSPRKRMMLSRRPVSLDLDAPSPMMGGVEAARLWGMPNPWLRPRRSDLSVAAPLTPEREVQTQAQGQAQAQASPLGRKSKKTMSAEQATRIAEEVEKLNAELAGLVTKLKARQEESDHIHALLIERAERAAQRIIVLQDQVQDLEEEAQETDSELTALRIALKAIEVQCPPSEGMDEELRQSIQNWKTDWKSLKEKRARRAGPDASALSTPRTPRH